MIIRPAKLIERYAAYRKRFLRGPEDFFYDLHARPCEASLAARAYPYQQGERVQFLRQPGSNADEPGMFLHVDNLITDGNVIKEIHHGDNTFYSPFALLSFVCEYVITCDLLALETSVNVGRMLQRLGKHGLAGLGTRARGRGESPADASVPIPRRTPRGYMLRADAIDDDNQDENFCTWLRDPDAAKNLEPSADQYVMVLSCLALAQQVLLDAEADAARGRDDEWPSDAEHVRLRRELLDIIFERVTTCHDFIAEKCAYIIRRGDNALVKRGPGAVHFAYPFSRIASQVVYGTPARADEFLKLFLLQWLREVIPRLVGDVIEAVVNAVERLVGTFLDALDGAVRGALKAIGVEVLGNLYELLRKHFGDLLDKVFDFFRSDFKNFVRGALEQLLGDKIRAVLEQAFPTALANRALAELIFEMFSVAVLQQPVPDPSSVEIIRELPLSRLISGEGLPSRLVYEKRYCFEVPTIDIPLPGGLALAPPRALALGGIPPPRIPTPNIPPPNIPLPDVPLPDLPDVPDLPDLPDLPGSIRIGGEYCVTVTLPQLEIDWDQILSLATMVFRLPLRELAAIGGSFSENEFLRSHAFMANAAARTFGITGTSPLAAAVQFDNALFMAIAHRFFGYDDDSPVFGSQVRRVMGILATAPDDFPRQGAPNLWDKDFRWIRAQKPETGSKIFGGLDYMVALTVAASRDRIANRRAFQEAIAAADAEQPDAAENVVRLPFPDSIPSALPVVIPADVLTPDRPEVFLGVVFERSSGDGRVVLRVPGVATELTFRQREPVRLVSFVMPDAPISVEAIDGRPRGYIVVGWQALGRQRPPADVAAEGAASKPRKRRESPGEQRPRRGPSGTGRHDSNAG